MSEPELPPRPDTTRATAARVYDYALGGSANFAVDRRALQHLQGVLPGLLSTVAANRGFLARVVRYALSEGIEQFLDLGSGVPMVGNVHEIAEGRRASARVVYVDYEVVAARQTRRALAANPRAELVEADFRQPERVLGAAATGRLLDFSRPVALLVIAALHYVPEDVTDLLRRYVAELAPGSIVALSHLTADDNEQVAGLCRAWQDTVAEPLVPRSHGELAALVQQLPLELLEPGLVPVGQWRPDPTAPAETAATEHWAAVARVC